jgi:hypothetical protein
VIIEVKHLGSYNQGNCFVVVGQVETCMNPNKKQVVRKKITPHLYEEKPIQYFMET